MATPGILIKQASVGTKTVNLSISVKSVTVSTDGSGVLASMQFVINNASIIADKPSLNLQEVFIPTTTTTAPIKLDLDLATNSLTFDLDNTGVFPVLGGGNLEMTFRNTKVGPGAGTKKATKKVK